jgi:hypothetical protein
MEIMMEIMMEITVDLDVILCNLDASKKYIFCVLLL